MSAASLSIEIVQRRSWRALLALAVATLAVTLCPTPAHAQFDYSLYGIADFSYGRFENSGQIRRHRVNSNSMSATFIGANASYGFENGWTPGITLESFFRFQDRKFGRNDDDPAFSRNAFVSLANRDYGTLRVGRLQTLLFNSTTRFNAFGNSVGFSPPVRQIFTAGNLIGVQGDFYWDRSIGYTTPNFGGITGSVIASRGEHGEPGHLYGGTLIVSRGLFAAALSAQRVDIDDGIADPTREDAYQLGANYNFGWANLFALYTHARDSGLDVRSNLGSIGAAVPLGPGSVLLQVATAQADGPAVDRKQTTTSAGYLYAFDSVTDLYIVAMDDRVRGQTRGLSAAVGIRWRPQ